MSVDCCELDVKVCGEPVIRLELLEKLHGGRTAECIGRDLREES